MKNDLTTKRMDKMIEISVRLWTDKISNTKGAVEPRHAWARGSVRVQANRLHGIRAERPVLFNSWEDLDKAIEVSLKKAGVTLH